MWTNSKILSAYPKIDWFMLGVYENIINIKKHYLIEKYPETIFLWIYLSNYVTKCLVSIIFDILHITSLFKISIFTWLFYVNLLMDCSKHLKITYIGPHPLMIRATRLTAHNATLIEHFTSLQIIVLVASLLMM